MIGRRSLLKAGAIGAAIPAGFALSASGTYARTYSNERVAELDPLDTMVRLRADTTGVTAIGWLDAVRETVIEREIRPFCRILSLGLSRFVREGDIYRAQIFEVAYYCEPDTNRPFDKFQFPGQSAPVPVPKYRVGPKAVNFGIGLDEWEENTAKGGDEPPAEFAPPALVRLERDVGKPELFNNSIYVRSDEYGRAYPDKTKPPAVFYREWIIWRGDADVLLETSAPSVPSEFDYNAVSGFRPWMEMGKTEGHTVENGRGAKAARMEDVPTELLELIAERDPDILRDPEGIFR